MCPGGPRCSPTKHAVVVGLSSAEVRLHMVILPIIVGGHGTEVLSCGYAASWLLGILKVAVEIALSWWQLAAAFFCACNLLGAEGGTPAGDCLAPIKDPFALPVPFSWG